MREAIITTEDIGEIDFTTHPELIEITRFNEVEIKKLKPMRIPKSYLIGISRAIADKGYRHGVKSVEMRFRVVPDKDGKPLNRLYAEVKYA